MSNKKIFPSLAILLTVILFVINHVLSGPPAVKPASSPSDEFSAERAYELLGTLLAEERPHPVGSAQNRIVKQRIMAELDRLGIEYEEQAIWSCGLLIPNCAFVENIIGVIPGRMEGNAIALMAHYDSVPMSPGAGDDAAGVVAILESARALALEAPFEHPIYLLITDAEEMGLLGAEAFFRQHPLAENVAVVLDFEGSGTTGASNVLRTNGANELLIRTLAEETSSPFGFSFFNEIFKRMPNDTGFSVPKSLGIAGIDFAFVGERNHYHTPNDNLSNIDQRVIQHHGENMLPLVRSLADSDLDDLGEQVLYGSVYDVWVQWTSEFSAYLILIAALLLVFSSYNLKPSLKGIVLSVLSSLALIVSISVFAYAAFFIIDLLVGTTVAWPAFDQPYRLSLLFAALSGGFLICNMSNRSLEQKDMLIGVWSLWLLMSLGLAVYLPDATNVLLLPVLVSALLLVAAGFVSEHRRPWLYLLTLVMSIPMTLGFVFLLEQSQGYGLIITTFPFIALFFTVLMPLLKGVNLKPALLLSVVLMAASIGATKFVPQYSEHRPQIVNIAYTENVEQGTSYYQLQSGNPISGELIEAMDFSAEPMRLAAYSESAQRQWAAGELSGWQPPRLQVAAQQRTDEGRAVEVELSSPRRADSLTLLMPEYSQLISYKIAGRTYDARLSSGGVNAGYYAINLIGTYAREVRLELNFGNAENVNAVLMDISTQLPAQGEVLTNVRRSLLSPAHRGDQARLIIRAEI